MITQQTPGMKPEPFYGTNVQPSVDTINNVNTNPNDEDYNNEPEALYAETPTNNPTKRRPPAPFTVGKPQRPGSMNNNFNLT
jgi:hypothetical protein